MSTAQSLLSARKRVYFVGSGILLLVHIDLQHLCGSDDAAEVSELNLAKSAHTEKHIGQGQLVFRDR